MCLNFGKSRIRTSFCLFFGVTFSLILQFFITPSLCEAADEIDKTRYITTDEIEPGMEAYCLTVYNGVEVEKFGLEVLSVVRDIMPGRDAILVLGTDERFIHSGPVAGCSGSPVYIEGRLAGALAFGWTYSKDALYGVTPIEEMLKVGLNESIALSQQQTGFAFDYSVPLDFVDIIEQMKNSIVSGEKPAGNFYGGPCVLPCPLVVSALPSEAYQQLQAFVEPLGLMAVAGAGGGSNSASGDAAERQGDSGADVALEPGAILSVPLSTGDITMDVIGTVTEVVDDKVYGFGHGFLGYGPIDLPMATGEVHTVVSNVVRSFKFGSALNIVGSLKADQSTAVYGRIGTFSRMIPLTIKVNRYNDTQARVYKCQVVDNRVLTGSVVSTAVAGAVFQLGKLPLDNTVEYKGSIDIEGFEPITFENISSQQGFADMANESVGSILLLLNNPYKRVGMKSLDFEVSISAQNITSHIWSVDLSDSTVKAGERIDIEVVIESVLRGKKKYDFSLKIPETLAAGKYDLIVCGGDAYHHFLKKAAPYDFTPQNLVTLIDVINNLLDVRRDSLYCVLVLPTSGVAVEKAQLPDLPATKALILGDVKRTLKIAPYKQWLEKHLSIGSIVVDKEVMKITVEK